MIVKKIGKAQADPEAGFWVVEMKPERFSMNQRLVDSRPDVKAMKSAHSKLARKKSPSREDLREEHIQQKKSMKLQLQNLLKEVYEEILKESFSSPILLRKDKDYDHKGDWRYCLYQGIIYQFDRPDYPDHEMIRKITQQGE